MLSDPYTPPPGVPTLRALLGDGDRTEGFAEWIVESFAASALLDAAEEPWKAMYMRLVQLMAVAGLEGLKREEAHHGNDFAQACFALAQAMGTASMTAALGGMVEDVPDQVLRDMARDFSATFAAAAEHVAERVIAANDIQKEASNG